jgi:asparagine synthetase B (glutamine-hydrolysing)
MTGDTLATQGIWSKVGEAAGHILHYPFNDEPLTDYAFSLPWSLKSDPPKLVLRDAARLLDVPDFVLDRPKRGFGIRPERWAPPGGVFEPLLALATGVYEERDLRELQTAEPLRAFTLWNALNHAIWRRLWIDGEPVERLLGELDEAMERTTALASP